MFFSVIMPLYNKAQYVAKTIASVLGQSYADWELIIVDDGSKDDSFAVASQAIAGCDKARLVKQENAGVSTARNNGVALAKGDYVCFLDADDWWDSSFLEEMAMLISEFPDAGIYGTSYYIVRNGKNRIAPIALDKGFTKGYIDYIEVYSRFLCMPLTSISVAIPRSVFNKMQGFKAQLKIGEDFDLWLRIALQHKVAFVNKQLSFYNQDVEQETRGVVNDKIYLPDTFFTFNLDCYSEKEKEIASLKVLLDKLRVYSLLRYRLQRVYPDLVAKEISKVNFANVDREYRFYYKAPLIIVRLMFGMRGILSKIKKQLL